MPDSNETLSSDTAKLYTEADPARKVSNTLFRSRYRRLKIRSALTRQSILDATYLSKENYSKKYRLRTTRLTLEENTIELREFYGSTAGIIQYQTFRRRALSLHARSMLDQESIRHAATLHQKEWITLYGGGRHRTFIYTGLVFPELHGVKFNSISAFLFKIGRYREKNIIWNRLKYLWPIDDALTIPVEKCSNRHGLIYLIRRKKLERYMSALL